MTYGMMAYDIKKNYIQNFVNKVERVYNSSVINIFIKEIINSNTLLACKVHNVSHL